MARAKADVASLFSTVRDGALMMFSGGVGAMIAAYGLAFWGDEGSVRYYAVDYDAGNDANLGYSDTSAADAGTKAVKTLARLRQIVPRFGNGRRLYALIKRRDSGGTGTSYGEDLVLDGLVGYSRTWVRGTATDATAGATAFADDSADRIFAGARQVTGTNAAGYKATGAPTVTTFDCLTLAGGAPGFAAEPGYIGKRIRFDAATPTVALRNVCRMIHENDTDTLTVDLDLPAVPATGGSPDIFYIEEPGVAVQKINTYTSTPDGDFVGTGTFTGLYLIGLRGVDTSTTGVFCSGTGVHLCFCDFAAAGTAAVQLTLYGGLHIAFNTWAAPDNTFPVCGVGYRSVGSVTVNAPRSPFVTNCAIVGSTRRFIFDGFSGTLTLGGGSYCGGASVQNGMIALIGQGLTTTQRVLRCEGVGVGNRVLSLAATGNLGAFVVNGVKIQNAGASACIRLGEAYCAGLRLRNVTGSTGNAGAGLNMVSGVQAAGCEVLFDTGNTFTGATDLDIIGADNTRFVHADYALSDFYDGMGNHFQGNLASGAGPGSFAQQGKKMTSDGSTTLVQYGVARLGSVDGQFAMAMADTLAHATAVFGVRINKAGTVHLVVPGGKMWIEFDSAPTLGVIAYLGKTTAGKATTTTPTVSATEAKLRLGYVLSVSGTKGLVAWNPDHFPVLADGLA
jgi:hypothetical protein